MKCFKHGREFHRGGCPDCYQEELERDAMRYRYLRGCDWWSMNGLIVTDCTCLRIGDDTFSGKRLDKVIDAAMKGETK